IGQFFIRDEVGAVVERRDFERLVARDGKPRVLAAVLLQRAEFAAESLGFGHPRGRECGDDNDLNGQDGETCRSTGGHRDGLKSTMWIGMSVSRRLASEPAKWTSYDGRWP